MFFKKKIENSQKSFSIDEVDVKDITCCFTGHRSQKLPWRFNENDERCLDMKIKLKEEIEKAIGLGYKIFLCGMALGFDMICAETVLELKGKYKDIKLIGAIPCKNQDSKWPDKEKLRYAALIKKLDGIRCIYDEYNGPECMLERNQYMVDNSSMIIALFNGLPGGTKKTIDSAKDKNLKIIIIKP